MKIAPASLTINQLFGSKNEQYVVPTYQRRYSWHERQVVELIEDITLLEDGDTHLLGSIVCLAGHHTAGLNRLELVDGHLDGTSTDAFFRYYLMAIVGTRITASEVASSFKALFMRQVNEAAILPERHLYADENETEEDEPGDATDHSNGNSGAKLRTSDADKVSLTSFLARLVQYAKVYGELVLGNTNDPRINRHLRNLRMIKAVQTYGFLMHLRVGGCPDKLFRDVLKLTESFVLRRHVCRERANETEALFARLCGIDANDPLQSTKEAYRELCPSDNNFREDFAHTSFSANLIDRARYCLERTEAAKHGNHDELLVLGADDVHVEHIMPQKIKTKKAKDEFGDWVAYLGKNSEDLHPKYVDRIGNLTLFAGSLNIGASNNPFGRKKRAYKELAILITKELASKSNFKFRDIDKRSKNLADSAVKLWPIP